MSEEETSFWMDWFPCKVLSSNHTYGGSVAVLILNRPVALPFRQHLLNLIQKARFVTAVDGGTTHLFTMIKDTGKKLVPDLICGDFDSTPSEVLEYFTQQGCECIRTPNEDETDFTKAYRLTMEKLQENGETVDATIAICQTGGRMDHVMGNLNTLCLSKSISPRPLYLVSDECVSWILNKGRHRIYIEESLHGSCCGIIPIGEPCQSITTTGLKWNLNESKMKFGDLISTSNTYSEGCEVVTIDTSNKVLWTMEMRWPTT